MKVYHNKYRCKLRFYRENAGFSQSELSAKVGVCRETITRVENGRHMLSLDKAIHIARILEVPVEDIFIFELRGNRK